MSVDAAASWRKRIGAHRGRLALAALFAIAIGTFFALDGAKWLSIDALHENHAALLAFADRHFTAALALAFVVYVAVIALSLPGALVLSLACGLVFGRWVGAGLAIVAATLGATLVFIAARYLFADAARQRLGARGRSVAAGFARHAWSYMLFLRLVPLFPFVLVNLASAVAPVRLSTYVAATAVGIIPGTFVYTNLGEALGRVDTVLGLLSPDVLFALTLLGVLALTPIAVGRLRARHAAHLPRG